MILFKRNQELTEKVKKYCKKIKVDVVGFSDVQHFDQFPKYNRPEIYLENSKTVIILGLHLFDLNLDVWTDYSLKGFGYQFADQILANFCNKVKNFITEFDYESKVVPYQPGLYLKDAAVLAGIGPIGKNNLLITKKFGSQVRLRALVTRAPLVCGKPITENRYCENCQKCIDACPATALQNGHYKKDRCYEYQITHLNQLSKYSSIWCNICIESCPIGKDKKKKKFH